MPERLTAGLGDSYEILHTAVKPHACCRYMQGPIDAVLALVREHAIEPKQVRRIEVAVVLSDVDEQLGLHVDRNEHGGRCPRGRQHRRIGSD